MSWSESSTARTTPNPINRLCSIKPSFPLRSSDRPGSSRPGCGPPIANSTSPPVTAARNFDFPDSDSDGDATDLVMRRRQQSCSKPTTTVARMPKLSRLIGAPSQDIPVSSTTSSRASYHLSCPNSGFVISTERLREPNKVGVVEDDHECNEVEDEDAVEEEEEEDDVKPWFRPASRDAIDKKQTNTESTGNRVKRSQKPVSHCGS